MIYLVLVIVLLFVLYSKQKYVKNTTTETTAEPEPEPTANTTTAEPESTANTTTALEPEVVNGVLLYSEEDFKGDVTELKAGERVKVDLLSSVFNSIKITGNPKAYIEMELADSTIPFWDPITTSHAKILGSPDIFPTYVKYNCNKIIKGVYIGVFDENDTTFGNAINARCNDWNNEVLGECKQDCSMYSNDYFDTVW